RLQGRSGVEGSHNDLGANTHFPRTFIYKQTFYSIFQQGKKRILAGERPAEFADAETIDQKILTKHRAYLARLESFPLKKAAYYQRLKESTSLHSVRALSEITGEDWSYIAKLLKILKLLEPIKRFLLENQNPAVVKHFHLRRLLEIVRLPVAAQIHCFRKVCAEITISNITSGG
ncbi:MAG: hypothetical protein COW12_07480, partial [Candidatus Omnitrophica bacterium CG12_big_fil_rev_8_21_14_0_65_45_16]